MSIIGWFILAGLALWLIVEFFRIPNYGDVGYWGERNIIRPSVAALVWILVFTIERSYLVNFEKTIADTNFFAFLLLAGIFLTTLSLFRSIIRDEKIQWRGFIFNGALFILGITLIACGTVLKVVGTTNMILPFIEIYLLAIICCRMAFRQQFDSDSLQTIFFFAVIELVIAAIVNALWLKQSFLVDVLMPIVFSAFLLYLVFHATENGASFPLSSMVPLNGLTLIRFIDKVVEPVISTLFIILTSSVCFALVRFDLNATIAVMVGSSYPSQILRINLYLFILSSLGLIAIIIWYFVWASIDKIKKYTRRSGID